MSLRPVPPSTEPIPINENVVGFLREALRLAETGEIRGAVLVTEHSDGSTSDRWATEGGLFPQKIIGALWLCLTRYTAHIEKREEEK